MMPVIGDPDALIIAHRGGGEEAPENSWSAFNHLRELGIKHLETDAHLSADGVVVLSHDPTVEREYGGEGAIAELTYPEILQLRNSAGEQMPRLIDVLEQFPDFYLNVDAKTDEVVEPLLQVLRDAEAADRTLVASFSEKRLERVREENIPGLSTSLGVAAIVRLMLAAETVSGADTWRVPGPELGVTAAQVPEKVRGARVLNPRFIATAHRAGLAVHVWTVNDAESMVRLLDWGVDGIVTDRPTMLQEILLARASGSDEAHEGNGSSV